MPGDPPNAKYLAARGRAPRDATTPRDTGGSQPGQRRALAADDERRLRAGYAAVAELIDELGGARPTQRQLEARIAEIIRREAA